MPDRVSDIKNVRDCQGICQKECEIECQNVYAMDTARCHMSEWCVGVGIIGNIQFFKPTDSLLPQLR